MDSIRVLGCVEESGNEGRAIDDSQSIAAQVSELARGVVVHEVDSGHIDDDEPPALEAMARAKRGQLFEGFGRNRAVEAQPQRCSVLQIFRDSQHKALVILLSMKATTQRLCQKFKWLNYQHFPVRNAAAALL
jgi:hypothetical protein